MSTHLKYNYGDNVIFKARDQTGNLGVTLCTVVGITQVETQKQSSALNRPVGSILYTVEFGDGSEAILSEEQLEIDPGDSA